MEKEHNIYTISNLLTLFRLCLIPVLVWLYCFEENLTGTAAVLLVSSLTDVADGFIAKPSYADASVRDLLPNGRNAECMEDQRGNSSQMAILDMIPRRKEFSMMGAITMIVFVSCTRSWRASTFG